MPSSACARGASRRGAKSTPSICLNPTRWPRGSVRSDSRSLIPRNRGLSERESDLTDPRGHRVGLRQIDGVLFAPRLDAPRAHALEGIVARQRLRRRSRHVRHRREGARHLADARRIGHSEEALLERLSGKLESWNDGKNDRHHPTSSGPTFHRSNVPSAHASLPARSIGGGAPRGGPAAVPSTQKNAPAGGRPLSLFLSPT